MRRVLQLIVGILGVTAFAYILRAASLSPNYTADIQPIMSNNCSNCHDWGVQYVKLVGPVSQYSPTKGLKIVFPTKPDSSVLIWRLEGKLPSGSSITQMPKFGNKLPDAEILTIRTWIQEGAPGKAVLSLEPPTNVHVSDIPNDQGYFISVTWSLSPSDKNGAVTWYRLFHSRSNVLTDPIPITRFASRDSLIEADLHYTILVDSVAAGKNEYTDFVPVNGETYYIWIQAVGPGGASKMAYGVQTGVMETPRKFSVSAPFPNPFNPSTAIEYTLSRNARVLLKIYSVTGQQVAVLVDGMEKAGKHAAVWNAVGMPSGVYIYTLSSGGMTREGKMLLLK